MKTVILVLIYAVSYLIYLVMSILFAPLRAIEKSQEFVTRFGEQH